MKYLKSGCVWLTLFFEFLVNVQKSCDINDELEMIMYKQDMIWLEEARQEGKTAWSRRKNREYKENIFGKKV